MAVDTRINIPFIPQEGITGQILSAMQMANEHHIQNQKLALQQQQLQQQAPLVQSETGLNTAKAGDVQAQTGLTNAQTAAGLPKAQADAANANTRLAQIKAAQETETNPILKAKLESESKLAQIEVDRANMGLKFFNSASGAGGVSDLMQNTRKSFGKLEPDEKAILDAADHTLQFEGAQGVPGALEHYRQAVDAVAGKRASMRQAQVYASMGQNRTTKAYLDTNKNTVTEMTPGDFIAARKEDPNRFVEYNGTVSNAVKASTNIGDIRDGVTMMSKVLNDKNFQLSDTGRTIMAAAHKDPTVLNTALTAEAMAKLSPQERDFFTASQTLIERAMSLRGLQGQGAGSESQRAAVVATLPNIFDPDPQMSKQKLEQFKNVVDNVDKGIPNIGKRGKASAGESQNKSQGNPEADAYLKSLGL